jgi:hypothetical protein
MPFIALKGRIPVNVEGIVNVGDFIIAGNNGKAKAINTINTFDEQNLLIGICLKINNNKVEVKI